MQNEKKLNKKFNRKKTSHLIVLILSMFFIPVTFNACGQATYDVALQGSSEKLLAVDEASPSQDSTSDNADKREEPNQPPLGGAIPPVDSNTSTETSPPTGTPPPNENQPMYELVKQLIQVNAQNKTDILIVEDDSGSMTFEQQSMANRFGSFIEELKDLDWQLGITTTDVISSTNQQGKDGRLLDFRDSDGIKNYGKIINSKMDFTLANDLFKNTIQRKYNEVGSPYEQGIFATYRFLERFFDLNSENDSNRALLRDSATFAVIFITDADETPKNASLKNNGESLKEYIQKQLGLSKRFSFHSIIVKPDDKLCLDNRATYSSDGLKARNENEGYGQAYADLSKGTGGLIGSVCELDYGTQLKAIGKLVADSVKTANLQCEPMDLNQDGMPDLKAMDSSGKELLIASIKDLVVTFTEDLPLGSTSLEYSCKK
ncbi:MAG TPA: hypothetical protein PLJ21_00740 [Pseudobdellovibrionaceae bacterium]|nr:hypothetical protein [Pseudobdellovibrionaceae bacterium]